MLKPFLEAGRIVGTHGVRGELRLEPWCDTAAFLSGFKTLYWQEGRTPAQVESARPHKSLLLLKLAGVDTVEQAEALRGRVVYIARTDARLPEGQYFQQDLLGCEVVDADTQQVYGKLTDIFSTGANDVYQVTDAAGKNYLLPAVRQVVPAVDTTAGRVEIRPIRGIFDAAD